MLTGAGMILGTAAYMAPEQARGATVDKRADLWAFGCVLWEMLTGRRPFEGATVSDTLAAVLKTEPDWSALPPDTPAPIRTLLRRCLEKDRIKRITNISVAQFLLNDEGAMAPDSPRLPQTQSRRGAPLVVASLAVAAVAVAIAGWMAVRSAPAVPVRAATRFRITLPPGIFLLNPAGTGGGQSLALSADGSQLAYFARLGVNGDFQLYTKSRNQLDPVPIRGARYPGENAPFFSPDGAWVAFGANGRLKKAPVGGGATLDLCDATGVVGGTWLPDDSIVFASRGVAGLQCVPSAGGNPTMLTTPDGKTESAHRWPEVLPGGKAVVFVIQRPGVDFGGAAIGVLRLDTLEWSVLIEGGVAPHYLPSGHLAFVRNGVMLAAPFDLGTLQVTGAPAQLLDGLTESVATGEVKLAVSRSGTVAYVPDGSARRSRALTWVDRTGNPQPLPLPHQPYEAPRLSPDGQQVAVGINNGASGGERNIWIYDFARSNLSRLTSEKEEAETPVWTPDGGRVSYATGRSGTGQFRWKSGDGSGTEEVLASDAHHLHFGGWSPTGDALIANAVQGPDTGSVWTLRRGDTWTLTRYLEAGSQVRGPVMSPDGRWLAYASGESDRYDVYVQRFPDGGARYPVSSGGGTEPVWARSGRELFYRNGDRMMAVSIDTKGNAPQIGTPMILFQEVFAGGATNAWYDVSPDGQRFLMLKPDDASATDSIVVIQDWMEEVKALVSAKK